MILEAAYAAHTHGWLAWPSGWARGGLMTAFYSWRLLIMTFHGRPRASAEVMSHVHESPLVMTLPLFVLSLGAIFSGWLGYKLFVGHDMARFWGDSILILPEHPADGDAHHVPTWVKLFPIVVGVGGFAVAYVLRRAHQDCRPHRHALCNRSTRCFSTSGISTSFTISCSFARPCASVPSCGSAGIATPSTGWDRTASPDGCGFLGGGAAAVRLRLPLCLCHADRRCRAGHPGICSALRGLSA